jgi:hypothetical protein
VLEPISARLSATGSSSEAAGAQDA